MRLEMSFGKRWPFCFGLSVLNVSACPIVRTIHNSLFASIKISSTIICKSVNRTNAYTISLTALPTSVSSKCYEGQHQAMSTMVGQSEEVGHATPDSKVHGANMGPIWVQQEAGGLHVGPMKVANWDQALTSFSHMKCVIINWLGGLEGRVLFFFMSDEYMYEMPSIATSQLQDECSAMHQNEPTIGNLFSNTRNIVGISTVKNNGTH